MTGGRDVTGSLSEITRPGRTLDEYDIPTIVPPPDSVTELIDVTNPSTDVPFSYQAEDYYLGGIPLSKLNTNKTGRNHVYNNETGEFTPVPDTFRGDAVFEGDLYNGFDHDGNGNGNGYQYEMIGEGLYYSPQLGVNRLDWDRLSWNTLNGQRVDFPQIGSDAGINIATRDLNLADMPAVISGDGVYAQLGQYGPTNATLVVPLGDAEQRDRISDTGERFTNVPTLLDAEAFRPAETVENPETGEFFPSTVGGFFPVTTQEEVTRAGSESYDGTELPGGVEYQWLPDDRGVLQLQAVGRDEQGNLIPVLDYDLLRANRPDPLSIPLGAAL